MLRNQATNLLLRAPDDDGAEGEGAASVRRADYHDCQAWPAAGAANGKEMNARRSSHDLRDRDVVAKLFDTLAPRFAERGRLPGSCASVTGRATARKLRRWSSPAAVQSARRRG
jgi:hypothetical protein